ncbi:hypothetical protein IEQ34_001272 [Dendrobium chrysotoxum]|uniref:Uncharacterized protein n=1 Tax=Dendrobium chrysotoxum TaxID=161865 RepID=A0AAV7HPL7_DENCH|nr:hypothetical protein IEQ34_001272 [Dendrobium chrysotoxum]
MSSKPVCALLIKRGQVVITTRRWAVLLSKGGEIGVYVFVIVDVRPEGGATSQANGVRSRESSHVAWAHILCREGGDER